jgi:hypothetical protein
MPVYSYRFNSIYTSYIYHIVVQYLYFHLGGSENEVYPPNSRFDGDNDH